MPSADNERLELLQRLFRHGQEVADGRVRHQFARRHVYRLDGHAGLEHVRPDAEADQGVDVQYHFFQGGFETGFGVGQTTRTNLQRFQVGTRTQEVPDVDVFLEIDVFEADQTGAEELQEEAEAGQADAADGKVGELIQARKVAGQVLLTGTLHVRDFELFQIRARVRDAPEGVWIGVPTELRVEDHFGQVEP